MNIVLYDRRRALGSVVKEMLKNVDLKPGESLSISRRVPHERSLDGRRDWSDTIECIGMPLSQLDQFLASPIEKLELFQKHWYTALHNSHIHYIGQLVRMYYIHILNVKGIGKYGLRRIQYALRPYGIELTSLPCGKKELKKLKGVSIAWVLRQAQIDACIYNERRIQKDPPKLTLAEFKRAGILTIGDALASNRQLLKRCFRRARARSYFKMVNSRKYEWLNYWTTRRAISAAAEEHDFFDHFENFLRKFNLQVKDVTPRRKKKNGRPRRFVRLTYEPHPEDC